MEIIMLIILIYISIILNKYVLIQVDENIFTVIHGYYVLISTLFFMENYLLILSFYFQFALNMFGLA